MKHSGTTPLCHFERSEAESRNLPSASFLSGRSTVLLHCSVISSGIEKTSFLNSAGRIEAGDLGAQSINRVQTHLCSYGHAAPLEMTIEAGSIPSFRVALKSMIRSQFPVGKKRNGVKPDRKPFANSFLPARNAMVSS